MGARILESNNYGLFEMLPFNRDVKKTDNLESSMKKHGFLDPYPIHVIKNRSGKLKIKAGHHRFIAAKKLGIAIKYVESQDDASIHELENATTKWTMADYLTSYVRCGKAAYVRIQEYCAETGIGLQCAISMLAGHSAGSGNQGINFKNGTYHLGNPKHAAVVGDIVLHCKRCGIWWAGDYLFVAALSKVAWAKGFDPAILKKKISTYRSHVQKQPSKQAYLDLIDSIFNFASRTKIPLAFNAEAAAKQRNAACHAKPEKVQDAPY